MKLGNLKAMAPFFNRTARVGTGAAADGVGDAAITVCVLPGDMVTDNAGAATGRVPAQAWCVLVRVGDWRSATPPRVGNVIDLDGDPALRLTVQGVDILDGMWRLACTRRQRAQR